MNKFFWLKYRRPIRHILLWSLLAFFYYMVYLRLAGCYVWLFVVKELFVMVTVFYFISWLITRPIFQRYNYLLAIAVLGGYLWWASLLYITCLIIEKRTDIPTGYFEIYLNLVLGKGFFGLFSIDNFPVLALNYKLVVSIPLLPRVVKSYMEQVNQNTKLQRDSLMMELTFLKSQVSPHFLFNTLNSIYRRAEQNDSRTPETILQLASLMRYVLYEAKEEQLSLQREVDFIVDYLSLAQMRYGDRVKVDVDIPAINEPYFLMPLLLIPFVENAIKHGPDRSRKGAWVSVALRVKDRCLQFSVRNAVNPEAMMPEIGGVGLVNVRKRLELLYKGRYELNINASKFEYHVVLKLKL